MINFILLALFAGACIAIQAAMNAQLGQIFSNSLLATTYAFFTSFILVASITLLYTVYRQVPVEQTELVLSLNERLQRVPWYLWGSCILSVIGVGSFYFLIPKMGVGNMMTYALTGQILVAMFISHFGFFDSPIKTLSASKLLGTALLITGIVLINKE